MEDQGVKSPETFLVNNFLSFNHCKNTDDDQCAFKWVLNTDHIFKAASWTLENKNDNVERNFKVEFNFQNDWPGWTTNDNMTSEVIDKTKAFALVWKINLNILRHAKKNTCKTLNIFMLLDKFCLIVNEMFRYCTSCFNSGI